MQWSSSDFLAMKVFLIACSLFVFCYAAERPVIPDTFDAKVI